MIETKKSIYLTLEDFKTEAQNYLDGYGLSDEEIENIAEYSFQQFNWNLLADEIFDCMDTIINQNYEEHLIQKEGEKLNKGERN